MALIGSRLFKILYIVIVASLVAGMHPARAETGRQAADKLSVKLNTVDHVWFYFVSRTEDYSYSDEQIRQESSIRLYRACGGNCRNVVAVVIDHLKASRPAVCLQGQQDALVDLGDMESIVYSYSGRMIRFEGKCYLSEKSIRRIIEDADLPFGG